MQWLGKSIELAGKMDIRLQALKDPHLEALWNRIGEI